MKWIRISIYLVGCSFIGLWAFQGLPLPQIELPKFAQHNTFGELPIVEMMDDGAFAEVDGAEAEQGAYWCDEMKRGFTCSLKFGMSYDVARRIGKEELLDSCEEAKKESSRTFEFCFDNITSEEYMLENYHLTEKEARGLYNKSIDRCYDQTRYIPECHGSHKDWLYDNFKGGFRLNI